LPTVPSSNCWRGSGRPKPRRTGVTFYARPRSRVPLETLGKPSIGRSARASSNILSTSSRWIGPTSYRAAAPDGDAMMLAAVPEASDGERAEGRLGFQMSFQAEHAVLVAEA
jgi:hypothetical protein